MEKYFDTAIKEAKKAYKKEEIPVGAVIVKNTKIIAKGYNNRQNKYDCLGHAEINAIRKAENKLKDWRLNNTIMYVTMKPCKMCSEIINEVRIKKVYYLIDNNKNQNKYKNIVQTNVCNKQKQEAKMLLNSFFKQLRK